MHGDDIVHRYSRRLSVVYSLYSELADYVRAADRSSQIVLLIFIHRPLIYSIMNTTHSSPYTHIRRTYLVGMHLDVDQ